MIAVVDLLAKAVWGIGNNPQEAMKDAQRWIAMKPNLQVGKLEYARLSEDADLGTDGETLFQWVLNGDAPVQDSLF